MLRGRACVVPFAFATLAAAGCGRQSTLDPASKASEEIASLWWIMLAGSGVAFSVVVLLVVAAVVRRHGRRPPAGGDRGAKALVLVGGVAVPIVALTLLFVLAIRTLPATSAPSPGETRLTVVVTGHQFFWEVRYPGSGAVTANEIHIPARTPVRLVVSTDDVIHSFWLPRLNRKIDLIPGRRNAIELRADRPGLYRGQCAEFCGLQHAHMAFLVFADEPGEFRRWLARQAAPAGAASARGAELFEADACAGCHTIRGTDADGEKGPDLTHVGGRTTLAAATIPNTREELARWIRDPQAVKPGNQMPTLGLPDSDIQALAAYLEGLK